ncbi:hypothetical protein [Chryseobacterium contaminans]|uniref:hypothetical protein n=1 Tax=Chryseobacterium contaminans TaxID=1423959 RepID=UPI00301707B2
MDKPALDNRYQIPVISITFEDEIPPQIKNMVQQYHGEWNTTFAQFFSNMKIEKIKFIGSTDTTVMIGLLNNLL